MRDLDVVERAFARGRQSRVGATLHREALARARVMMTSEQLKSFDVSQEPASVLAEYGDSAFGRGCLAARRLIEVRRALRRSDARRLGFPRQQP